MTEIIEVIYQNGVFKPLRKVKLREGEIVKWRLRRRRRSRPDFTPS